MYNGETKMKQKSTTKQLLRFKPEQGQALGHKI